MSGITTNPSPSTLFKTAAFLYGISAPGHVFLGFDAIYPALKKIPRVQAKDRVGARGAENCWNYVAVSLGIAACLNWQWARTGGPKTVEEEIMFWSIVGMHAVNGLRYLQVGAYAALGPMWVAPVLAVVAKLRSGS